MAPWGICPACDAWGFAPPGFDERRHVLVCPCGRRMFLHNSRTAEAARREQRAAGYRHEPVLVTFTTMTEA